MEKGREFQKNIFCFIDYAKAFDCVDHSKLENSERDGNTRPLDLPLAKLQWGYQYTPVIVAIIKSLQTINAGEGVEKRDPTDTGNVNCYNHYGEQYESS